MLVVDSKKINKSEKDNDFVKIYEQCMSRLLTLGIKNVILESPPHKVHINEEGQTEFSGGAWGRYREKFVFKGREYDVIYYETSFPDKHGNEQYRPRKYSFNGQIDTLILDTDADKLFFLVFVSPHCQKMAEIAELQNSVIGKRIFWKVRNEKADSETSIQTRRNILQIENAIYSQENGLPFETIKTMARNLGMGRFDGYTETQVRLALGEFTLVKNTKGVYDKQKIEDFIKMIPKGGVFKTSQKETFVALASELKEYGIVKQSRNGGKMSWCNKEGKPLEEHPMNRKGDDVLLELLTENEEIRKELEAQLTEAKS